LQSKNIVLREVCLSDDEFILELINQPAWKKYISDHSIDTLDQTRDYIESRLIAQYRLHGYGLWVVESNDEKTPIGLCGLIKRDYLDYVDLGFGFIPRYWGKSFAYEASVMCLDYAFNVIKSDRVLAVTVPENGNSINLLDRLGFKYKNEISLAGKNEILSLYEKKSELNSMPNN